MRTNIDHLPPAKQRELERVVQLIFEEFEDAHSLVTSDRKKRSRIKKIVLYGSYARGGWVDEPHTAKGYQSDFDILIVVNDSKLTDRAEHWAKLDDRLLREFSITGSLRTPVNFIVHSLQQVNDGLAHGRYFFMDIARDGIALYESDDVEFHQPKPKAPQAALKMAREYYDEWFPAAAGRRDTALYVTKQGRLKEAVFNLHQAAEFLYHGTLLVCTFYTPHNHNLAFLRTRAETLDLRLVDVWPRESRKDRAMFSKLREAYVKARYSKHYRISIEEIEWLSERIEALGQVANAVCAERLAALEKAVELERGV
ncbi:nucleotidyltransferase [Novosphingobium indicum]|uniref:Nucleotidyltransferase n=1 Tax=Novosphingobium indicum TaxID=462949 RepID=A0ABQ2JZI2_9SPHN|nr:nucleotidyltransferase and HEPN domain-containing protein [Novosphingobium indicum]GGN59287.1 nucleotidyltransferase [Novosphingobium indicum]